MRPHAQARPLLPAASLASLCLLLMALSVPRLASAVPPVVAARRVGNHCYMELTVTAGSAAPDCYEREVILVNGMFQPAIQVYVNETVHITLINKLPQKLAQVASGISIHWHGLYMWNNASWYDGTAYGTQCPIGRGQQFTYEFLVNEAPGTYIWHDHASANKANGMMGAFIVMQPDPTLAAPFSYKTDYVMFLTDWQHEEGNALAMRLNRPVSVDKQDENTGYFMSVPTPASLLINGKGSYTDCSGPGRLGDNGLVVPTCQPEALNFTHPITPTGRDIGGCTHEVFDVEPGQTYRFRLINAASSTYMTVCLEGHTMEMVMADGLPTEAAEYDCIDLDSGQRYDVLITAKSRASANKTFWFTVHSQLRSLSPSAYAVLRYPNAPKDTWPDTPSPQPGMQPWSWIDHMQIYTHEGVLGYLDNYEFERYFKQYSSVGGSNYFDGILFSDADRLINLNITQPVMTENGMIRWAMNNVATPSNPPCLAAMQALQENPGWVALNTFNGSDINQDKAINAEAASRQNILRGRLAEHTAVYNNGDPTPIIPVVGLHVAEILRNEIIEIVINNRPAGEGDPNSTATTMVSHPMHLHGHKFWLMGMGMGVYDKTRDHMTINTYNPILRDTMTLPVGMWAVLRFRADNPGLWPFHCHNLWHSFMGQQMLIIEDQIHWPAMPKKMPKCPEKCIYNFAQFTESYINRTYGPAENARFDRP